MKSILNKEKFFLILFLLLLLFITFFPLYRQISFTPPGTIYTLIHRDFVDYYGHIGYIHQGRIQNYQINPDTTETSDRFRVHIFYLLLGKIASLTHISDILMYYLSMLFSLIFFYIFTILLIKLVVPQKYFWWAFGIIFLGSTLPNFSIPIRNSILYFGSNGWFTMDIYSRLTYIPHYFFGLTTLIASVYFVIRFYNEKRLLFAFICALSLNIGLLMFAVPGILFLLSLSTLLFFSFFYYLVHKKPIPAVFILGFSIIYLTSLVTLLYVNQQLTLFAKSGIDMAKIEYDYFRQERWPFLFTLFLTSYGILPILILIALKSLLSKLKFENLLILFLLFYPPILYLFSIAGIIHISKARFIYSNPYVFGGILATYGLITLVNTFKKQKNTILVITASLFSLLAFYNLKTYWWPKLFEKNLYTNFYIPKKYFSAMDYLNNNTPRFSSVFATFYSGVFIPAFTYNKVFVGHTTGTINYNQKLLLVDQFFKGEMTPSDAKTLLLNYHIDYVFWEYSLYGDFVKSYGTFLTPVYQIEDITIYKVH